MNTRGFEGPDVRWSVKIRCFVGLDITLERETRGVVHPGPPVRPAPARPLPSDAAAKFIFKLLYIVYILYKPPISLRDPAAYNYTRSVVLGRLGRS